MGYADYQCSGDANEEGREGSVENVGIKEGFGAWKDVKLPDREPENAHRLRRSLEGWHTPWLKRLDVKETFPQEGLKFRYH